jgi:hypothetical protein
MMSVLPPDPETMNDKRAAAAQRALLYFARDFGEADDYGVLPSLGNRILQIS